MLGFLPCPTFVGWAVGWGNGEVMGTCALTGPAKGAPTWAPLAPGPVVDGGREGRLSLLRGDVALDLQGHTGLEKALPSSANTEA